MMFRTSDEEHEKYLERRHQAAIEKVGGMEGARFDRITCFMMGARWERETQGGKSLSAATGTYRVTVGDLSAAMIGNTTVRVTHEGGTVEGVLLDIEIDTDHANIPRGGEAYRFKVTHINVSLRVGSFVIDGLPIDHPVEIVR